MFVQHSERSYHTADKATKNNVWEMFSELIPRYKQTNIRNKEPLEQYNLTKDDSDYLWYTTRCCFFHHTFILAQYYEHLYFNFPIGSKMVNSLFVFVYNNRAAFAWRQMICPSGVTSGLWFRSKALDMHCWDLSMMPLQVICPTL